MRIIISVLLIVSGAGPGFLEHGEIRSKLETLFSNRHYAASEEKILALGPGAKTVLQSMANDESLIIFKRVRAVHALQFFHNEETSRFLKMLMASENQKMIVRVRAMSVLARMKNAGGETFIARYLNHRESLLRLGAADALKSMGTKKAMNLLDKVKMGLNVHEQRSNGRLVWRPIEPLGDRSEQ